MVIFWPILATIFEIILILRLIYENLSTYFKAWVILWLYTTLLTVRHHFP